MRYDRADDHFPAGHNSPRDLAGCLPFLLDAELASLTWADQRAWNVRRVPELGGALAPSELYDLSWRIHRILVTPESAYLDDTRFPVTTCPGVIVVGPTWRGNLDRLLVLVVGLLGPFARLYHGVKVSARETNVVEVTAPAGPHGRRATRRLALDRESILPEPFPGIPLAAIPRRRHFAAPALPGV